MTGYELNDKGVVYLVEAIGVLAVKDYRHARNILSRKGWEKRNAKTPQQSVNYEIVTSPLKTMAELERFFLDGWFEMLSGIDGRRVLDKISRECDKELARAEAVKEQRSQKSRKHKTHAPGSGRKPGTDWSVLRKRDPELAGLLEMMKVTRATLAVEMGIEYRNLCVTLHQNLSDQTLRRIKEAVASLIGKRTR